MKAADKVGRYVSLEGFTDLQKAVERLSDKKKLGRAVHAVWAKEAIRLQPKLRSKMKHRLGGTGKLAKSYRVSVSGYKANTVKMDVYSRVKIAAAQEYGAVITPKKGKYLAIPTPNAGGRTVKGKRATIKGIYNTRRRLRPRMLKNSFVRQNKKGFLVIYQKVASGGAKLKKYFRRAKRGYRLGKVVPMFVLLRRVVLPPRTNIRGYFPREIPKIAEKTLVAIERLWGHE